MATTPALPVLGSNGYVTTPNTLLNFLFAHAFEVRYDDINLFRKEVMSFQTVLADYGDDPRNYCSKLQSKLNNYFSRYFDEVTVTCEFSESADEDSADYEVDIDVVVRQDETNYSLGRALTINATTQTAKLIKSINR